MGERISGRRDKIDRKTFLKLFLAGGVSLAGWIAAPQIYGGGLTAQGADLVEGGGNAEKTILGGATIDTDFYKRIGIGIGEGSDGLIDSAAKAWHPNASDKDIAAFYQKVTTDSVTALQLVAYTALEIAKDPQYKVVTGVVEAATGPAPEAVGRLDVFKVQLFVDKTKEGDEIVVLGKFSDPKSKKYLHQIAIRNQKGQMTFKTLKSEELRAMLSSNLSEWTYEEPRFFGEPSIQKKEIKPTETAGVFITKTTVWQENTITPAMFKILNEVKPPEDKKGPNRSVIYENKLSDGITQKFELRANEDLSGWIDAVDIYPERAASYYEAFNLTAYHIWQSQMKSTITFEEYKQKLANGDEDVKYNTAWGDVDPRKGFTFEIAASVPVAPRLKDAFIYSHTAQPGVVKYQISPDGRLHILSAYSPYYKKDGNDQLSHGIGILNNFTAPLLLQGYSGPINEVNYAFAIDDYWNSQLPFLKEVQNLLSPKKNGIWDPIFRLILSE